jgi:hypothetical protein
VLGCIFLALAATLHPFYGSAAAYSPDGNFAQGLTEPDFNASLGKQHSIRGEQLLTGLRFFGISAACMNVLFMICSFKINAVFLLIFAGASLGFTLLASSLWALAEGAADTGAQLLVVCGNLILIIRS